MCYARKAFQRYASALAIGTSYLLSRSKRRAAALFGRDLAHRAHFAIDRAPHRRSHTLNPPLGAIMTYPFTPAPQTVTMPSAPVQRASAEIPLIDFSRNNQAAGWGKATHALASGAIRSAAGKGLLGADAQAKAAQMTADEDKARSGSGSGSPPVNAVLDAMRAESPGAALAVSAQNAVGEMRRRNPGMFDEYGNYKWQSGASQQPAALAPNSMMGGGWGFGGGGGGGGFDAGAFFG